MQNRVLKQVILIILLFNLNTYAQELEDEQLDYVETILVEEEPSEIKTTDEDDLVIDPLKPLIADSSNEPLATEQAFDRSQMMGYENRKLRYRFSYPAALVSHLSEARKAIYHFTVSTIKDKSLVATFLSGKQLPDYENAVYSTNGSLPYSTGTTTINGQTVDFIIFSSNKSLVIIKLSAADGYTGVDQSAIIWKTILSTLQTNQKL